jgi:integrase
VTKSALHQILDRSGLSPVTKEKYTLVIDRWIEFAGAEPVGWTLDKAQAFYDQLVAGGVKPTSANTYLASLRYVSKWYAKRTGSVDFAHVQKQRGKKGAKQGEAEDKSVPLTRDEAEKLLRAAHGDQASNVRDFAMLVLALETGMRRMSLQGCQLSGISHSRGYPTITVPIKGPGGEETFTVPLSNSAWLALDAWIRRSGAAASSLFVRLVPRNHGGIRVEEIGEVVSLTGINEIVAARSRMASIRHVNPHLLRHTFISWREQAGLTPFDIAEITGHKVSTVVVQGASMNVGAMGGYIHRDVNAIRNSTPAWLAQLVEEVCT